MHGSEINLILIRLIIELRKLITNKVELKLRRFMTVTDECGRKKIISFIRVVCLYSDEGNNKSTRVKLRNGEN